MNFAKRQGLHAQSCAHFCNLCVFVLTGAEIPSCKPDAALGRLDQSALDFNGIGQMSVTNVHDGIRGTVMIWHATPMGGRCVDFCA